MICPSLLHQRLLKLRSSGTGHSLTSRHLLLEMPTCRSREPLPHSGYLFGIPTLRTKSLNRGSERKASNCGSIAKFVISSSRFP
jgi:hypothetical protein